MPSAVPRLARKLALVCLALAAIASVSLVFVTGAAARVESSSRHVTIEPRTTTSETVRGKYPLAPRVLQGREGGAAVLAFPPRRADQPKPLTVVYLHGVHGRAENGCPWLRDGASEIGWLVCPEANQRLANDTFSWAGSVDDQRAVVAHAERAAQAEGADPEARGVLVGFSQGAYVALDLLHARLGRYRGLVLIGADVQPSRALLATAGVTRVVLAAGDLDGASAPMRRAAEQLRREGVEVRFVSLGRIGHSYETTEKPALAEAIAWSGAAM